MNDAMAEVLAQLDPDLRKSVPWASEIEIVRQRVPSIGLNNALDGGFVYGRQVLLWGNKSAGKSTFCLEMISDAMKEGKTVLWIDVEKTFDPTWAAQFGINVDDLIVYQNVSSVSKMVEVIVKYITAGIDIIIVDSISMLLPSSYFKKGTDEQNDMADSKQMGTIAKELTEAVARINDANSKTLVVMISQLRNKLGSMFVSQEPTGGEAMKFASSSVVKLWSSASENNAIKEKIQVGDKLVENTVGREVTWTVNYNKTGPAFVSGNYNFYYKGPRKRGIDQTGELFDIAVGQGLIEKSGNAWFIIDDQKINGKAAGIKYLEDHPEKVNELVTALG